MPYYSRKPTRIPKYDYSNNNCYFITLCTKNRNCIFGTPKQLNYFGNVVKKHILELESHYAGLCVDRFVVMPNHIHLLLSMNMGKKNPDIRYVVAMFKAGVTREIRTVAGEMEVWQRSFHDHIIRNEKSYEKIWNYIEDNPRKWEEDCFYCRQEEI